MTLTQQIRAVDDVRVGSLFSGIGGIDLGLERAGMEVVWQCEADPWCRRVLAQHWPDIPCYDDVRTIGANAPPVDVLAGGFPCQPVSKAGKLRAQADERWLWPYFARLVRLLRPRFVLVENVPGLLARGMGDVLGDLAGLGYDAEWESLPASSVGAPHLRDRVFIVAYPDTHGHGCDEGWFALPHLHAGEPEPRRQPRQLRPDVSNGDGGRLALVEATDSAAAEGDVDAGADPVGHRLPGTARWPAEPDVDRVVDGFPGRVDRIKGLGNAVVPQLAEWIGRRLMSAYSQERDE